MIYCTTRTAAAQVYVQRSALFDGAYSRLHTLLLYLERDNEYSSAGSLLYTLALSAPITPASCEISVHGVQLAETRVCTWLQLHSYMCAHLCYPCNSAKNVTAITTSIKRRA